ncbi:MAG: BREX-1 system phosphatase PglZ type A [Candidatus Helarchaeota archaeon]
MSSKISQALQSLFEKHRIVFWYDDRRELKEEFQDVYLLGVEKLEIDNNQFSLKYHILREEPDKRFLLYHAGEQPDNLNNWLLDVQLANGVFSADKISMWMAELELGPNYRNLFEEHQDFFNAASRRDALKERDIKGDDHHIIRLKMMATCMGASVEAGVECILLALFDELASGKTDGFNSLEKYGLTTHFWRDLSRIYGYDSEKPHINDFAINLFESCYKLNLHEISNLLPEVLILLNHWQDSAKYQESFEALSDRFANLLNIKGDLDNRSLPDLLSLDLFKQIDYRILEELMKGVLGRSTTEARCKEILHQRSSTYWYGSLFKVMYQAVYTASQLFSKIKDIHLQVNTLADGLTKYASTWYQIDQLYREYIYDVRQSKQTTFFNELNKMVEGYYNNNFLKPLNNNWQLVVDEVSHWGDIGLGMQRHFYTDFVDPILAQNAKVAVIISDAMRYEVGEALRKLIVREGRFTAEISEMLGVLPSYTQLGMAALLPNNSLEIQGDGTVTVDNLSASGTDNRGKVLAQTLLGESQALLASDIGAMTTDERRILFRENQVVYVYHNQIDAVGDKLSEEGRTVEAVETTLNELLDLIKMLSNANFTKILLTSDHGFLYQHQDIDESDFAVTDITGDEIYSKNRRYVVGKGLNKQISLKYFTAEQVDLAGYYEIMIAKSINRMRLKGASIRFVHGGASLQEIVIPVVSVTKERTSSADVKPVDVDKINGSSNKITTGQISVKFYQLEPVSAKISGRTLRAGIYAGDGSLISNVHTLNFNFESSNPRDREMTRTFQLVNTADKYNGQIVYLCLEELIPNTTKYQKIKEWPYHLDKTLFTLF